jgi:hypothetical protein
MQSTHTHTYEIRNILAGHSTHKLIQFGRMSPKTMHKLSGPKNRIEQKNMGLSNHVHMLIRIIGSDSDFKKRMSINRCKLRFWRSFRIGTIIKSKKKILVVQAYLSHLQNT